ncbi:META domain-containing protein [Chloroflexia bacterium SDU3-3]|nr:META domain-containing protein [Chloroflexia bacterium SDU3-3]
MVNIPSLRKCGHGAIDLDRGQKGTRGGPRSSVQDTASPKRRSNHMRIALACLLLAGLLLASCGGRSPLDGTTWTLASIGGTAPVAGSNVGIAFKDGNVGGSGGCNQYGGTYQTSGEKIQFGEIVSTLMACADNSLNDQEQRFLKLLQQSASYQQASGTLTLRDGAGGTLLVFQQGAAQP